MLEIKVEENKYKFIELLNKITREGADIPGFIYKLEHSDFFEAPCSTVYHLNVKGGLCLHCLNVYEQIVKLANEFCPNQFSEETLIIAALCHDMDKMNKYELYFRNVKVYCENGSKKDEIGRFEWKSEKAYKVKEGTDRFIYGHHGQNSEYITSTYIPLRFEESVAIVNHSGGDDQYKPYDMSAIFNKHDLAVLLHMADFISTYLIEPRLELNNE